MPVRSLRGKPPPSRTAAHGADVDAEVDAFIAKFDGELAALIRSVRAALRRRFPTAHELIYDNYNFLVFGFSPTRRPSDTIVSLAAGANGVGLAFPYVGTRLHDPDGLLQGSGTSNRFVRIPDAATLERPAVRRLIDEATALVAAPLPAGGEGRTIVVSVSAKQRPRRKAGRADSR